MVREATAVSTTGTISSVQAHPNDRSFRGCSTRTTR
jgi:hypothetical protein